LNPTPETKAEQDVAAQQVPTCPPVRDRHCDPEARQAAVVAAAVVAAAVVVAEEEMQLNPTPETKSEQDVPAQHVPTCPPVRDRHCDPEARHAAVVTAAVVAAAVVAAAVVAAAVVAAAVVAPAVVAAAAVVAEEEMQELVTELQL